MSRIRANITWPRPRIANNKIYSQQWKLPWKSGYATKEVWPNASSFCHQSNAPPSRNIYRIAGGKVHPSSFAFKSMLKIGVNVIRLLPFLIETFILFLADHSP